MRSLVVRFQRQKPVRTFWRVNCGSTHTAPLINHLPSRLLTLSAAHWLPQGDHTSVVHGLSNTACVSLISIFCSTASLLSGRQMRGPHLNTIVNLRGFAPCAQLHIVYWLAPIGLQYRPGTRMNPSRYVRSWIRCLHLTPDVRRDPTDKEGSPHQSESLSIFPVNCISGGCIKTQAAFYLSYV